MCSAPGLAWQAMLKSTVVKLELFTHATMYLFVEGGIHEGNCTASYRYSKANNKYMGSKYDLQKEDNFIYKSMQTTSMER